MIDIPRWNCSGITMNFVTHLPRSIRGCDAIWVVVVRLTKCVHFFLVNMKYSLEKLSRLHISDRDCTKCLLVSFMIEILDLLQGFGKVCKEF